MRLLIIILAYEGKQSEEIAAIVKQTGVTVRKYMKRYNAVGIRGLEDIPYPKTKRIVTESEMREIDEPASHLLPSTLLLVLLSPINGSTLHIYHNPYNFNLQD